MLSANWWPSHQHDGHTPQDTCLDCLWGPKVDSERESLAMAIARATRAYRGVDVLAVADAVLASDAWTELHQRSYLEGRTNTLREVREAMPLISAPSLTANPFYPPRGLVEITDAVIDEAVNAASIHSSLPMQVRAAIESVFGGSSLGQEDGEAHVPLLAMTPEDES